MNVVITDTNLNQFIKQRFDLYITKLRFEDIVTQLNQNNSFTIDDSILLDNDLTIQNNQTLTLAQDNINNVKGSIRIKSG